ncbi:TauD/TfdA dioxygenase family protein [Mycolicibacterium iranicum]|uniref:Taurine catabolism dioxygenase n=1 Tax=Mycolicibacterium iranicum TaxID=912594 RepID=A0A1X1WWY9_MYCIR|nr:TauD/TfdA family dioxygenase [Mycolicibacterium iranicum]ORV91124.1 taurine catabolism dioxygenase [Mycolicibacterium iranicum]
MHASALTPLGAEVTGVRVDALDEAAVTWMRRVLAEHGVVILRRQQTDDDALLRFLRSFGDIQFTAGETPVPTHPDLNVVTNVGRSRPPRSTFHVDTSYVRTPPAYTALRAVAVPEQGGYTLFSNQYRAHDTLPENIRDGLEGRLVTHVATGVTLTDGQECSAEHPVLHRHPVSGRTSLYLSALQRCASLSGMTADQSAQTLSYLFAFSTRADNVLTHRWEPGDVVMWDNRCVMHRADHSGVVGDRVMHRGMVSDAAS